MKKVNIKEISKLGALCFLVSFLGSSCVKSYDKFTDFENLTPHVLIAEGGLQNFTGVQALQFPDSLTEATVSFHLNYAAKDVAPSDQVIEIGIDEDALVKYNAANGTNYIIFPAELYDFPTTSVTVPKGASYSDAVNLVVHPDKVDPSISYMLPISIKSAPAGSEISANFGTIYYHFIGNPIAGPYTWDWTRYNTGDLSGPVNALSFTGAPTVFTAISPTSIEVPSGYFNQPRYIISFTNTGGVLSDFTVTLNEDDVAVMNNNNPSITVVNQPSFMVDPATGVYQITYSVNSGGAPRSFIDKYYR